MIEIVYGKRVVSGRKAPLVLFAVAATLAGCALFAPALAGATQTECIDEPIKCLGNSDGGSTGAPAKDSGYLTVADGAYDRLPDGSDPWSSAEDARTLLPEAEKARLKPYSYQQAKEYWARARAALTHERCGQILRRINRIAGDDSDRTTVKKLVDRWQSLDCEGSLVGRD